MSNEFEYQHIHIGKGAISFSQACPVCNALVTARINVSGLEDGSYAIKLNLTFKDKKSRMVDKSKWVWMPYPGYGEYRSEYCHFFLNTFIPNPSIDSIGYIVSTIGEYKPRPTGEIQELYSGRKYETAVFHAQETKIDCCPYVAKQWWSHIDFKGYDSAEEAYKGHYKMCEKWAKK